MRYALVSPEGIIDRLESNIDPTVQTRAGWRWLAAPPAPVPAYDPFTQVIEGPTRTVQTQDVSESYTIRAKTPAELDADKEMILDRIDVANLKAIFNHENRIRALESKTAITPIQFRAAIKVLL